MESVLGLLLPFSSWAWNTAWAYSLAVGLSLAYARLTRPGLDVRDKHVFITGGSTGLGLAVAQKFAEAGANLTILSRNQKNLDNAKAAIAKAAPGCKVLVISSDVTKYDTLCTAVAEANAFHGRVTDYVIASAGLAAPGYFLDSDLDTHRWQMELNYFGVLNTVKATCPAIVAQGDGACLVLVSSAVAFAGMVGYAQYAPSKFAVRGLADCLRNELLAHDINVVGFYPSNLDTPGFAEEQKTKPIETQDIEGSVTLFKAEEAAGHLMNGLAGGHYGITNELLCEFGRMGTGGPAPRANMLIEMAVAPLMVVIGVAYGFMMDYTVRSHAAKRAKTK